MLFPHKFLVFPCLLICTDSLHAGPRAKFAVRKSSQILASRVRSPLSCFSNQVTRQEVYGSAGQAWAFPIVTGPRLATICLLTTMPTAPGRACDTAVSSRFLNIGSRPKFVSCCFSQSDQLRKPCTLAQIFRTMDRKNWNSD